MSNEEKKEEEKPSLEEVQKKIAEKKLPQMTELEGKVEPCPVLPSSIEKIMATLDQLDKGEIDEFDAVQQVTATLKEHRKSKIEALTRLEVGKSIEKEKRMLEKIEEAETEAEEETATE